MDGALRKDIIEFLVALPFLQTGSGRRARVSAVGLETILAQVDLDGNTGDAVTLLVNTLEHYGLFEGEPALVVFLREVATQVGTDKQRQIQDFCTHLLQELPEQSDIFRQSHHPAETSDTKTTTITTQGNYFEQVTGHAQVFTGPVSIHYEFKSEDIEGLIIAHIAELKHANEKLSSLIQKANDILLGRQKSSEVHDRQNKLILLKRVNEHWISVLDSYQKEWIDIGKEQKDSLIERPRGKRSQDLLLPLDSKLVDLFGDAVSTMLIVGDAGAGKTFSLLELARQLLIRAMNNPIQPVPVILNLSSWNKTRQSLADWLIKELNTHYGISKSLGNKWVKDREDVHLLYMLDGLDEVDPGLRKACLQAINQFHKKYGLAQLVISCRYEEYQSIDIKLQADKAILLKPLTFEQIEHRLPEDLNLRDVIPTENDQELQKFMTPLVLHIMSHLPIETIKAAAIGSLEDYHRHLFKCYTDQMFAREVWTKRELYQKGKVLNRLTWLAQKMKQHNQSEFFLEQLQPTWLANRCQFYFYLICSRSIIGSILGITLCAGASPAFSIPAVNFVLGFGIIIGLIIGLIFSISGGLRFELTRQTYATPLGGKNFTAWFLSGCLLPLGMITGGGLLSAWFLGWNFINFIIGAVIVMTGSAIFEGRPRAGSEQEEDICTYEKINWGWMNAIGNFLIGLILLVPISGVMIEFLFRGLFGVSFGKLVAITFDLGEGELNGWIFIWLAGSLSIGLFSGLISKKPTITATTSPNQAIWLSVRNAILVAFLGTLLVFILTSVILDASVVLGISITGGVVFALVYGGFSFIQHFTLRLILWYKGYMDWHYVQFLNYAVERIFLRKIGGGYMFIHNLLRDYFASLN